MTPSALLLLGTWALVFVLLSGPMLTVHLWLHGQQDQRRQIVLPVVVVGLLGYLAFFVYLGSAWVGRAYAIVALAGAWIFVLRQWRRGKKGNRSDELILPLACAGALGLFYLALLYLPQLGESYVMQSAARFVHRLPPDPDLPETLGNRLYLGESLKPFAGDWLSSDRPPLQAGLYLLTLPWLKLARIPSGLGYECTGVFAQLLWVQAAWLVARRLSRTRLTALCGVLVVASVGTFVLNSVYVWPKLLAAAYVACAGVLLLDPTGNRSNGAVALAAAAGALGWLAHGTAAFSLAALGLVWLLWHRSDWRKLPLWLGVLALLALPWVLYQKFGDPPGDRLLKWHLAGVSSIDPRSFLDVLRDAYRGISWNEWVAGRRSNLRLIVHGTFGPIFDIFGTSAKPRRHDEFFYLIRAIGVLNLAWLVAPASIILKRLPPAQIRLAVSLMLWSVATVLLWSVLMFAPASTLLHQGSYAVPLVACTVAAMLLLAAPPALGLPILVWHAVYFVATWLPYYGSRPLNPGMFVLLAISIALLAFVVRQTVRHDRLVPGGSS